MRFVIAILPLDTYRAKAQHKGGEIMPITTDLHKWDAQAATAGATPYTAAEEQEIRDVATQLEDKLRTLAQAGNSEAIASCQRNGITYGP